MGSARGLENRYGKLEAAFGTGAGLQFGTTTQLQNRRAVATGSRCGEVNQRQNLVFLRLEWYERIRSLPLFGSVTGTITQRQNLVFLRLEWYRTNPVATAIRFCN